jgi:hypothetical protein
MEGVGVKFCLVKKGRIMNMQKGNLENEHKIEGFDPCHCLKH